MEDVSILPGESRHLGLCTTHELPIECKRQKPDILIRHQAEQDASQATICNTRRGLHQSCECIPLLKSVSAGAAEASSKSLDVLLGVGRGGEALS